ncbi:tRNA(Phe) 7-((3-amino-3-carboxypropyl)-4-demethylwyosine(37)-N(4))-methyltransferase [Thermogladius sp.]|uniref:tRNA(Phe) 7-((3-amino-3-carboxypropyl)-4-demethylwyosine(37)-N(4))- methyltransferase n=1 Tax=Thermogladius sp. TaxID=2023064 RepID=UPI003D0E9494
MVVDSKSWYKFKKQLWSRLWEDLEIGYLDKDLLPVLVLFNLDRDIYTLSSCSGRIVVSDSKYPWSREESNIVLKKHVPLDYSELDALLKKPVVRRLWLNATGPIIHLSTRDPRTAAYVLRVARLAGYKHSGVLSVNRYKGVIVELTTGVRFSTFLAEAGNALEGDDVRKLVEKANEILLYGKLMLNRLYEVARRYLPRVVDEEVERHVKARGGLLDKAPAEIFVDMMRRLNQFNYIEAYKRIVAGMS